MTKIDNHSLRFHLWMMMYIVVQIENGDCGCTENLITGPYGVNDSYLSASSWYHNRENCHFRNARILPGISVNDYYAWCPTNLSKSEYLQVEFRLRSRVTGYTTMGRYGINQYVKSFTLRTSSDGINWSGVTDKAGNLMIFSANNDATEKVTRHNTLTIVTKFIRVHPETWYHWPSIHIEIHGCPGGHLCWMRKTGVPDQVLTPLRKTTTPNVGLCGRECFHDLSCMSFMFDSSDMECYLYPNQTFNTKPALQTHSGKQYFVNNDQCVP